MEEGAWRIARKTISIKLVNSFGMRGVVAAGLFAGNTTAAAAKTTSRLRVVCVIVTAVGFVAIDIAHSAVLFLVGK